jgi:hypothetical protein
VAGVSADSMDVARGIGERDGEAFSDRPKTGVSDEPGFEAGQPARLAKILPYTIVQSLQKHSRRAQDTEIGGQRRDHGECAQPTE